MPRPSLLIAAILGVLVAMAPSAQSRAQSAPQPKPPAKSPILYQPAQTELQPTPRGLWRQIIIVGRLELAGRQDAVARELPLALRGHGFGLAPGQTLATALAVQAQRLIATGLQPGNLLIIARGEDAAAAVDVAAQLKQPALNLVLIDGCAALRARAASLPRAHILAVATGQPAPGPACGLSLPDGGQQIDAVSVPFADTKDPRQSRLLAEALARAILLWAAPDAPIGEGN